VSTSMGDWTSSSVFFVGIHGHGGADVLVDIRGEDVSVLDEGGFDRVEAMSYGGELGSGSVVGPICQS
jgi:hypothetical protein